MDKLDVKTYRLLRKLYIANKNGKNVMIKYCRERESLLEKEYISCAKSIEEWFNESVGIPQFESVENRFEYIRRNTETPLPYRIDDNGIEYYLKHRSDSIGKAVPIVISTILALITIAISIIAIIAK